MSKTRVGFTNQPLVNGVVDDDDDDDDDDIDDHYDEYDDHDDDDDDGDDGDDGVVVMMKMEVEKAYIKTYTVYYQRKTQTLHDIYL